MNVVVDKPLQVHTCICSDHPVVDERPGQPNCMLTATWLDFISLPFIYRWMGTNKAESTLAFCHHCHHGSFIFIIVQDITVLELKVKIHKAQTTGHKVGPSQQHLVLEDGTVLEDERSLSYYPGIQYGSMIYLIIIRMQPAQPVQVSQFIIIIMQEEFLVVIDTVTNHKRLQTNSNTQQFTISNNVLVSCIVHHTDNRLWVGFGLMIH